VGRDAVARALREVLRLLTAQEEKEEDVSLSQGYAHRACTEIEELIAHLQEEDTSYDDIVEAVLSKCREIKQTATMGFY
jgi:hypothetical protein